ncbi:MAG: hypothetical protein QM820_04785 [Minicystis sp.]
MVDCADAACTATHTCVTATPAGWNGPVVLYDGDPGSVPECPPDHPTTAYTGNGDLVPEPAMCGACACSQPAVNCLLKQLMLSDQTDCSATTGTIVQPTGNQCLAVSPPGSTKAFFADAPAATPGACTPLGGAKTVPAPKWQRAGLVCSGGGLGLGCGAGKFCTGKPAAPFVDGLCIWRSGDVACPASFPSKHGFTDSVVDTRDCTGCFCGAPTASCSATTRLYSNSQCNGAGTDVPNDGSCVQPAGNVGSVDVTVTTTASCPATGGQPVGSIVAGAAKTTVCCTM